MTENEARYIAAAAREHHPDWNLQVNFLADDFWCVVSDVKANNREMPLSVRTREQEMTALAKETLGREIDENEITVRRIPQRDEQRTR